MTKQKKIKTNKVITAEDTEIGKGVTLTIDVTASPIIYLLRATYKEDPTCISGDIDYLFKVDAKENDRINYKKDKDTYL
jgi:hypothetical protein